MTRPLLGRSDTGTFSRQTTPRIGDESKHYISNHAVLSSAAVIFRVENMLARIDVRDHSSGEWLGGDGLSGYAEMLAKQLEKRLKASR